MTIVEYRDCMRIQVDYDHTGSTVEPTQSTLNLPLTSYMHCDKGFTQMGLTMPHILGNNLLAVESGTRRKQNSRAYATEKS